MSDCLVCRAAKVESFLDLGVVPLANALLEAKPATAESEARYPLQVGYCHECHAVQLLHLVAPEELFSNYFYESSFSDAFVQHSKRYADDLKQRFDLGKDSFVVEVASNDGYLLKNFVAAGVPCLGVEPAQNIAVKANAAGVPTLAKFFSPETAAEVLADKGAADVLIGNNVLAHVPELVPFLEGVRSLLKEDGVAVFEFPWLREFMRHLEFDTVYHEHVYYFSLHAVAKAAELAGLELFDVQEQKVHGGSLRVFLQKPGARSKTSEVERVRQLERSEGLAGPEVFRQMGQRVRVMREQLVELLAGLKKQGKSIVAYGASAKGSTLLNYCGLGADVIDYIVDRSTVKQGRFAPGVHLPIYPVEKLLENKPDYALLLAWNFADEIRQQQRGYEQIGGRFIHPVPEPRILADVVGEAETTA